MYRHIVMFWLKDRSEGNIALAQERLRSLAGKIEGLLSVEVEPDALRSDRSCDLCLNMLFDSRQSLDAYRTHPAHLPVQKHMHAVRERSTSADYPISEPPRRMPKLYAFIGPSCADEDILGGLLDAGMCGVRISMQHYTCAEAQPILDALASAGSKRGLSPEVLLDDVAKDAVPECLMRTRATGLIVSIAEDEQAFISLRKQVGPDIRILSKVDCQDHLDALPVLLTHADELVIARGGMGRNLMPHRIPAAQKRVASLACAAGKPFMLGTELLASMLKSPFPTTAELSDIYNAVCDGAASLMLTREVAIGDYPVLAMETLRKAAEEAVRV